MIRLLRRLRLRSRLLLAFGTFCLLMSVMTWVGITQSNRQADIADEVGRLQVLTRDVMRLKVRDADVSGWQVAAAVEEQSATTGEINRNVSEVAAGSQHIAANVAGVADIAGAATPGRHHNAAVGTRSGRTRRRPRPAGGFVQILIMRSKRLDEAPAGPARGRSRIL